MHERPRSAQLRIPVKLATDFVTLATLRSEATMD